MRIRFFIGLLLVSLSAAVMTSRGAVVNAFRSQEQQVLTVTGRVVSSGMVGEACHLYFGHDPKRSLAAVIPAEHRSKFPDRPDNCYQNQYVQVSGSLRDKEGRLEIVLNHPDQIAVVKPGTSIDSAKPQPGSLRLETRMARLEAELRGMKQRMTRSERSDTAMPAGSNSVQPVLPVELGRLVQHMNDLARRVRDLEDDVDQLARALISERRGSR